MPKTPKNKKPYWSGNLPIDSDFGSEVESTYAPTPSNMVDIDLATENINKQLELEKILTSSDAFKSQDRNDPLDMAASYTPEQIDYLQTYGNDIAKARTNAEKYSGQVVYPQPLASGAAEYVPFWASLMPGTPAVKGLGKAGNFVLDALNPIAGMGKIPGAKNIYKANPWALKQNPETYLYRARPEGQDIDMNMVAQLKKKEAAGEPLTWWQKNLLISQDPNMLAREKYFGQWFENDPNRLGHYIDSGTNNFKESDPIEILRIKLLKENADQLNVSRYDDAKILSSSPETEFILPKDKINSAKVFPESSLDNLIKEDAAFNTPHWLKGFQPPAKPTSTPGIFGDINYHAPYKPFSGKIESKPFIYEDHYSPHLSVDDGYTAKQIQDHFNYLKYRQDQARNLEYNNLPEEIRETYLDLIRRSQTPEGIRRANEYYRQSPPSSSGAGIIPEYTRHLKDINIKDDYLDSYGSARNQISINHNLAPEASSKIMRHELEHALQGKTSRMDLFMNKEVTSLDKDLKDLELIDMAKLTEEELDATSSFYWNDMEDKFGGTRNIIKEFEKDPSIVFADNAGAISYFNTGVERSPFLAEVQQHLLDNKLISHAHAVDEITPELIEKVWKQQNKLGDKATLRILKISKPTEKNFKLLANTLNKMLTTAAVLKAGEGALNTEQEQTPQYKYGGLIPNYNFKYGGIIA